ILVLRMGIHELERRMVNACPAPQYNIDAFYRLIFEGPDVDRALMAYRLFYIDAKSFYGNLFMARRVQDVKVTAYSHYPMPQVIPKTAPLASSEEFLRWYDYVVNWRCNLATARFIIDEVLPGMSVQQAKFILPTL